MNAAQDDQTFEDGLGGVCVLQALHGCPESSETQSVVWTLEPAPHIFIDIVCFVKGGLVRFVGMPKFRVKKSLSKITRTLEALIEAVKAHQDLKSIRESCKQLYFSSIIDVIPKVPMCFDSGLTILSSLLWINRLMTDLSNSSSTDFPVSKTDDRRLLANTSGDTSKNI